MALPPGTTATLAALGLAAALVAGGCSQPVHGPILVLTLATSETKTEANAPVIREFAHEVDVRSAGTIRIDVAWDVNNPSPAGSYQLLARAVADGTYDLGVVPSRAWDVLGVTSLRALNTPFLVTSDAAVRAVLAGDVRDDLLTGLPAAGVVGIDLWPGEMRRPFGFGKPLLRPTDFQAQVIRSPMSRTAWDLIEALGATPVETQTGDSQNQRGMESSFSAAGYHITATGNVVFFPRIDTLVANDAVRPRLRPDQWRVIDQSAAATRRDQVASFPSDEEWARAFCRRGNEISAATPSDVAAFEKVGQKVRTELEKDPSTARLIDEIEAVVSTVPPVEPITACPSRKKEPEKSADGTLALDGIYVARVTRQQMVQAGITDPEQIKDNTGRYTWTLDGGLWHYRWKAKHYLPFDEQYGQYSYEDGQLTFYWDANEVITSRLVIDRDGTIHFKDLRDNLEELQKATEGFFSSPWRRVGDLPN